MTGLLNGQRTPADGLRCITFLRDTPLVSHCWRREEVSFMTLSFGANPEFLALMTLEVGFYTYSVHRALEDQFPVKNHLFSIVCVRFSLPTSSSQEITPHLTLSPLRGSPRLMYKRRFSSLTQTLSDFGFSGRLRGRVGFAVTLGRM